MKQVQAEISSWETPKVPTFSYLEKNWIPWQGELACFGFPGQGTSERALPPLSGMNEWPQSLLCYDPES